MSLTQVSPVTCITYKCFVVTDVAISVVEQIQVWVAFSKISTARLADLVGTFEFL